MLQCLHDMPQQCQQAWQMAMDFTLPADYARVNKIIIFGVGGSAIGGDLLNSLAVAEAGIPIITHRGYNPPAFVDAQTLVIASSYSGMTEETLSPFRKTLGTDARKLAITTGGRLKAMAEENNIPVFSFDYKAQPRAALAFSLIPVLGILYKLGFVGDKSAEVAETVQVLQELSEKIGESVPTQHNPAKQLAQELHGKLLVIYGADIVAEVAHRWKTQLNENSKTWTFYEAFPELNHNSIVGYRFPTELVGRIAVVLLESPLLPYRIKLRYKVTCQLLKEAGVSYQVVEGEGSSPLSQMMSLVLYGDYVSYYLAMLNKIDPTPVKEIAYLKEQLAKDKGE